MKNTILSLSAILLFLTTAISSGCGSSDGDAPIGDGINSGNVNEIVTIKADYTADIYHLKIVENSGGNAVAVWRVWDGTGFSIYGQYYDAYGDTWGDTETITSVEGKIGYPQVVIDDFGNAVVVWQQNDGSDDNIYANHYDSAAGRWEEPILIEADAGNTSHPSLALNESGNVVAVWQLEIDNTYIVYANVYDTSAGVWGVSEPLSSGGNTYNLQLAVDDAGNAVITWEQWDGTTNKTFGTNYDLTTDTWLSAELS